MTKRSVVILLIFGSLYTQVMGGCMRYGHSCYGAHGKRNDIATGDDNSESLEDWKNRPDVSGPIQIDDATFRNSMQILASLLSDYQREAKQQTKYLDADPRLSLTPEMWRRLVKSHLRQVKDSSEAVR